MKGYKAYEKGLVCRGKQYAENTVFEEDSAEICKKGMHFCQNPLDCLDYYDLIDGNGNMTEFTNVEALDEAKTDDNKKFVTKKLKVGVKLSLEGFISAALRVTSETIRKEAENSRSKNKEALVKAGGSYSKLAGGYNSKLAGGDNSKLAGGKHSILVGDDGSKAKGKIGTLLVLVEREWKNDEYIIKNYGVALVDGERIREDTFYKLKNGEFVEVK